MPHREAAGENSIDARLESTIGQFYFKGLISSGEFDAGVRYGKIVMDYLQSIDAPGPYGGGFHDLPQTPVDVRGKDHPEGQRQSDRDTLAGDVCFNRKIMQAQSRQILKDAAIASKRRQTDVIAAVDRLTVYGEAPRTDSEMAALHIGLRALAHGSNVIPFGRPASRIKA